jgi:hypothetical protein
MTATTLVSNNNPGTHKFLRKSTFFDNWVLKEEYQTKSASWRNFASRWQCKDLGALNMKIVNGDPGISYLLDHIQQMVFEGYHLVFSNKRILP